MLRPMPCSVFAFLAKVCFGTWSRQTSKQNAETGLKTALLPAQFKCVEPRSLRKGSPKRNEGFGSCPVSSFPCEDQHGPCITDPGQRNLLMDLHSEPVDGQLDSCLFYALNSDPSI